MKNTTNYRYLGFILSMIALEGTVTALELPLHLNWGNTLVSELTPEHNEYASSPSYIHFAGQGSYTITENRSLCSSFITELFKFSYNLTDSYFYQWTGSSSPDAALYHDLIVSGNGFTSIESILNVQPGDIMSIKYNDGTTTATGHSMVVSGFPKLRSPTNPIVSGTIQYEIPVIDSSKSGHGPLDTRLMPDGTWDSGAGEGVFRVYVNPQSFAVVGHTWSTYNGTYYTQNARHLAVGRFINN